MSESDNWVVTTAIFNYVIMTAMRLSYIAMNNIYLNRSNLEAYFLLIKVSA